MIEVTEFGVAVVEKKIRMDRSSSNMLWVYMVEMLAMFVALRWMEEAGHNKVLICSDNSSF